MGIPKKTACKRGSKRGLQSNTSRKRGQVPVAYIPPVSRVGLQELRSVLCRALPLDPDSMTFEALKALDARCWEPGLTTQEFSERYLDAAVLKRWQGGSSDALQERRQVACTKLLDSEIRCAESNRNFYGREAICRTNARIPVHLIGVLRKAQSIIGRLLGRFDWEAFPHYVDFTSGATTEFPRSSSKVSNKWQTGSHITRKAAPYGEAFRKWTMAPGMNFKSSEVRSDRLWDWPDFQAEECNVVFTVPKNVFTERTACKGTTWNNALQKGAGGQIRRRCQSWHEPLLQPEAQVYHGLLARLGSGTGLLNTGDLVGASDSVAVGHITTFFPSDWAAVLLDLREEYGIMPDGTTVRWEKIGSMGNGYTFEVETVLFYGLLKACCKNDSVVSVYGDDLIYPHYAHDLVTEVFTFCGFEFNREKTFSGSHPFRESCGAYFHSGRDVKPFYLEKWPSNIGEVIKLHNDVVMWHRSAQPSGSWGDVIAKCRELVPKRYWGPLGVSGTLWCEWDEATPKYVPAFQSWKVLSVALVVQKTDDDSYAGRYLSYLWNGKAREDQTLMSPIRLCDRGKLTGYTLESMLSQGSEPGYTTKVEARFRCVKRHVDRQRWIQLSAHNIEQVTRARYDKV